MKRDNMLNDEMFGEVVGGSEMRYGIENDPLFKKFTSIWDNERGSSNSGMNSRAELLDAFRGWLQSGMPGSLPNDSGERNV